MKASQIIQCLTTDGLTLSVSGDGNLKILGDQDKIDNWIETIRENKSAILAELKPEARKYSVTVTDASTDPVLIRVLIKGLASFELAIPQAYYDGIALLEVLENTLLKRSRLCETNANAFSQEPGQSQTYICHDKS